MTRSLAVSLAAVAASMTACASAGGTAAPAPTSSAPTAPAPTAPAPTSAAAAAWEEPADYSFSVVSECGERSFLGEYDVVVRGGAVVEALHRDHTGAWTEVPAQQLASIPTLGEMLDEVRQTEGDPEAGEVVLETDPADGHPTEVRVDHVEMAIDDESCYTITAFATG